MSSEGQEYPVVLRFGGMWPADLGGYEKHRQREGGDLGHVDETRTQMNRRLIGPANWAQLAHDTVKEMELANFARELEGLERRRRPAEIEQRLAEGPRNPWRGTRHGPMREMVLTVNREWFEQQMTGFWADLKMSREDVFELHAIAWIKENFGENCVHARADLDETTYHIHAVILPQTVTPDGRRMLQPSVHPLIRHYEKAQDSIGEFFMSAGIGLTRGERRKQALREALEHNRKVQEAIDAGATMPGKFVELPEFRDHVTPRKGREAQEIDMARRDKALAEREAKLEAREAAVDKRSARADEVLSVASDVAEGRIDLLLEQKNERGGGTQPNANEEPSPAHRMFGAALKALRKGARKEARAELAVAFSEIRAADEAILKIARMVPPGTQRMIADARKALSKAIVGLSRRKPGPEEPDKTAPKDR